MAGWITGWENGRRKSAKQMEIESGMLRKKERSDRKYRARILGDLERIRRLKTEESEREGEDCLDRSNVWSIWTGKRVDPGNG